MLDQVARDADALLGGSTDSALLIDESGITKKGRHSVGVSRQWNGRLVKVDNCQVGVFAGLSRGALAILRERTKGELTIEVLHRRVWLWDGTEPAAPRWHLLVRRELGARADLKYSLSNAAADTPVLRLAQMQGQRFWVERAFQDGKSHAGLDHYQARGWRAWHHHMALVMMAMLFMLEERVAAADT